MGSAGDCLHLRLYRAKQQNVQSDLCPDSPNPLVTDTMRSFGDCLETRHNKITHLMRFSESKPGELKAKHDMMCIRNRPRLQANK